MRPGEVGLRLWDILKERSKGNKFLFTAKDADKWLSAKYPTYSRPSLGTAMQLLRKVDVICCNRRGRNATWEYIP